MAERRMSSTPGPYPSEGQGASRLIAIAAIGGALAMTLIAFGILAAWPMWRWTESSSAGPPAGWAAAQLHRAHDGGASEMPLRPLRFGTGSDDPGLPRRSPRPRALRFETPPRTRAAGPVPPPRRQ